MVRRRKQKNLMIRWQYEMMTRLTCPGIDGVRLGNHGRWLKFYIIIIIRRRRRRRRRRRMIMIIIIISIIINI